MAFLPELVQLVTAAASSPIGEALGAIAVDAAASAADPYLGREAVDLVIGRKRPAEVVDLSEPDATPKKKPRNRKPSGQAQASLTAGGGSGPVARFYQYQARAQGELHSIVVANSVPMGDPGNCILLAPIPQGVTDDSRLKKRITLKRVELRGYVNTLTSTSYVGTKWAIVYDRRCCGSLPSTADVFGSGGPLSVSNNNNTSRFDILHESYFRVNEANEWRTTFSVTIDLEDRPAVFGALATGTIADYAEGSLLLMGVSDSVLPRPEVVFVSTTYFI